MPSRGGDRLVAGRSGAAQRGPVVRVDGLTRVVGEAGILVRARGGRVEEVQLRVGEPRRFFERLLAGRAASEVPDLASRICGACPVAHQLAAVQALEAAGGVVVDGPVRALRRLLALGEWIASHVHHIVFLSAPDFLGHESALRMARESPALLARFLSLRKAGLGVVAAIGGRAVHPVNVRVGGFHTMPARRELAPLAAELVEVRPIAEELLSFAASLRGSAPASPHELVALHHPTEYGPAGTRVVSSAGLDGPVEVLEQHLAEETVPWSTAVRLRPRRGGTCAVGPLARYGLGYERLGGAVQEAARKVGLPAPPVRDPLRAIAVRALETVWAVDEALRILGSYSAPERPWVEVPARPGTGAAAVEAPQGLLLHRYRLAAGGLVEEVRILSPTAQNLPAIEADLAAFVEANAGLAPDVLTFRCEQLARSHDPCLPCATH